MECLINGLSNGRQDVWTSLSIYCLHVQLVYGFAAHLRFARLGRPHCMQNYVDMHKDSDVPTTPDTTQPQPPKTREQ